MAVPRYTFVTHWRVPGTCDEAFRIIDDPAGYPVWWPSVWLRVEVLEPGDENGIGKIVRVTSKGWLPYILSWTSETIERVAPERIRVRATGDLEGAGCWNFSQDGPEVAVRYDWEVLANKPLLRVLSPLLRPVFATNHRWAMNRGEESLKLELTRRRAGSADAASRIAPPPGPVFLSERRRRRLGLGSRTTEPPALTR